MELNQKNVEELLDSEDYKKHWTQFKRFQVRQLRTKSIIQEHKQLGFHSLSYYSPMKACFSFEVGNLDLITHLSPVLLRDGVLGLIDFFNNNPVPQEKTLILIHKSLSYLIPNRWLNHCLGFQYESRLENRNNIEEKRNILVIGNSGFGKKQGAQASLELLLSHKKYLGDIEEIWLTNFPTFPKDSLRYDVELQNEQIEIAVKVGKSFSQNVLVKTPYQIEKNNVSNSYFWDLNHFQFYYSDSFFFQSLQANGSKPFASSLVKKSISNEPSTSKLSEIEMSFNHKLCIYKFISENIGICDQAIKEMKGSSLFNRSASGPISSDNFPSKAIEEIAFKMALDFYTP